MDGCFWTNLVGTTQVCAPVEPVEPDGWVPITDVPDVFIDAHPQLTVDGNRVYGTQPLEGTYYFVLEVRAPMEMDGGPYPIRFQFNTALETEMHLSYVDESGMQQGNLVVPAGSEEFVFDVYSHYEGGDIVFALNNGPNEAPMGTTLTIDLELFIDSAVL